MLQNILADYPCIGMINIIVLSTRKCLLTEVFEKSNGRLKIEVFHSGQLFGIREIMGGITSGAVDLGGVVGVVGFPKLIKTLMLRLYQVYLTLLNNNENFFKSQKKEQKFGVIY